MTCLYCQKPATVGPHRRDDDGTACTHRIDCTCGKWSWLSASLDVGEDCEIEPTPELPLFQEIA